ncbi:NAD-dependent epimerase/dehydratase family protein [Massilibacteroides vaginae]|uniref:NAD-dependent epimerase/dehydratase family protein n=1 Tax=Massilibacteroides vaginae TaxID=1673718 RepID=UPI000A1CD2B6|nr:NAD-dependent epimerase/dehydratase family protein [Massilibacteroides vaginae]
MKTILITGAYGFVGSNLAAYLKGRYTLWALDVEDRSPGLYARFFSWKQFDSIPWEEIQAVIHLAGKAHDTKNMNEAQVYFDVNTGLTQKIFDSFLASKAKQFIFFSSVKAAADSVTTDILTEDVIPAPVGPYGESKIRAEEYILSKDGKGKGVYIFRPCMIHGPGNKGNLNLLYAVINKGIPYPLGAFDNRRSFTSIDNLSFIINKVMESEIPSGVYHIADDKPLSTKELIRIICRVLGKKERVYNLPKGFVEFAAKCGDVLHLPLNTFRLNKLTENYVVSNLKIKQAIGVEELPVSAHDGLIKTIRSFGDRAT